jgi:hypothetical protein
MVWAQNDKQGHGSYIEETRDFLVRNKYATKDAIVDLTAKGINYGRLKERIEKVHHVHTDRNISTHAHTHMYASIHARRDITPHTLSHVHSYRVRSSSSSARRRARGGSITPCGRPASIFAS